MNQRQILIIKTGHSEVFNENKASSVCSLGDVLRCSFLLNYFQDEEVLWLTNDAAIPLIKDVVNTQSIHTFKTLNLRNFDQIINLEKDDYLLEELSSLDNVVGFKNRNSKLIFNTYPQNEHLSFDDVSKKIILGSNKIFQYHLAALLGHSWNMDEYIFREGNEPNIKRIGLNWKVGKKWPEKSIGKNIWEKIGKQLESKYEISWQEGFDDLQEYIDWIDSCSHVITLDSLGLHISLALKKSIIALFGPTNANEVELFGRGQKVFYSRNLNDDEGEITRFLSDISKLL